MRPALALSLLLVACGDPGGYVAGVDPRCPTMQGLPPASSPVPDACYYQCSAGASRCSRGPDDAGLTVVDCVDTQTDPRNCGACRTACPSRTARCVAGQCT